MSSTVAVAIPSPHAFREGWGWLLLATVSRAYLVFLLSLATCALLPMLTGLSGSVVQSGSMEPHIGVGDVVLSRALPADSPPPMGRVVTFRAPAGSARSGFVLHRVVGANENGSLVTAGDANANVDSAALDRRNILSVASLLIPWIGLPVFWATTGALLPLGTWALLPLGTWALLTAGAVFIDVTDATSRHRHRKPGGSTWFGRGKINPDAATNPALPRRSALSSLFRTARAATAPTVVSLAVLGTVAALAMAPFNQASAAFSARTSSVGNTWTVGGPAVQLAFTTSPSGSTGGVPFATQPVVTVQDASDNTVTVSAAPVTLSITTPGGATLTCTANPKNAVSGVATFAGCSINKKGTYTLTATSGTLTSAVSTSLTITTGPAVKLAFTASPPNTTANSVFATQPVVAVQDAGGNIVSSTASVTLSITGTPGGTVLTCTANPKNAVSGVATFAGCSINKKGTYTLTATSGTLTSAVSTSFTITAGPAVKLAFTTQPSGSAGGIPFANQPVVAIQDTGGNTVSSTASVTLSITSAPGGATLTCTANPKNAVSGVATFAGCSINKKGTYTLTATSGTLTSAVSTSFTITG